MLSFKATLAQLLAVLLSLPYESPFSGFVPSPGVAGEVGLCVAPGVTGAKRVNLLCVAPGVTGAKRVNLLSSFLSPKLKIMLWCQLPAQWPVSVLCRLPLMFF